MLPKYREIFAIVASPLSKVSTAPNIPRTGKEAEGLACAGWRFFVWFFVKSYPRFAIWAVYYMYGARVIRTLQTPP